MGRRGKHQGKPTGRKQFFAWVFGAVSVVAAAAVAATMTITATGISAGSSNAAGCDTSITLGFGSPTYDTGSGEYVVGTVTYSGLDTASCAGLDLVVTVADSANNALANGTTGTIGGSDPTSGSITLSQSVAVGQADRIAAAIS